jgi:hypothetical protein
MFRDPTFVPDFARMEQEEKEAKLVNGDRRGMRGRTSVTDRAAANIFNRDKLACWYGSNQFGCKRGCSNDDNCAWGNGVCSEGSCGECGCDCS